MSFILDALKKSESERNRQSGPVLMDVRIAPPRRNLPIWVWGIGAVLLANLAILGYLVLHEQPQLEQVAALPTPAIMQPAVVQPAPGVLPPPTLSAPPPATAAPSQPEATLALPVSVAAPTLPGEDTTLSDMALPTVQDLLATGVALPELRLDLHAYDPIAGNRYILLNSKRLREGEFTADGIKVERITARGAILDSHGRRFMLVAGG